MTLQSAALVSCPLCGGALLICSEAFLFYCYLQTQNWKKTDQTHLPISFSSLCKYCLCKHYKKGSKQFKFERCFSLGTCLSGRCFSCVGNTVTAAPPSLRAALAFGLSVFQELGCLQMQSFYKWFYPSFRRFVKKTKEHCCYRRKNVYSLECTPTGAL